jgi:hypothetical protein
MPAAQLQGVTIAWSSEGLAFDPLADLLAMLPPPGPGAGALQVALRPAGAGAAADPLQEGWEPSFFHGIVQAYRGAGGFLLWDRASRARVPPGGGAVEAEIAAPEREIEPGSAAAMLQIALALALRGRGLYHLHAAALEHPSGAGVLVVGGSGAGKTTTTLALLEAGAAYLGDDALFLEAPLQLIAFPREFHLGAATLEAFPRLAALAGPVNRRGDKRPLDPRRAYPGRHRPRLGGVSLALFPTVAGGPVTDVVPLARAEAFGHLLASSAALVIEGLPGRDENLALLGALLGAARCFELRLGRDALADPVSAVAGRVEACLGSLGHPPA